MKQLLAQYLEDANKSGYLIKPTEHPLVVVDRGSFLHIVLPDDDGGYMVSRWYKSTAHRSGDYSSHPEVLESTLEECLTYVRDWSSV